MIALMMPLPHSYPQLRMRRTLLGSWVWLGATEGGAGASYLFEIIADALKEREREREAFERTLPAHSLVTTSLDHPALTEFGLDSVAAFQDCVQTGDWVGRVHASKVRRGSGIRYAEAIPQSQPGGSKGLDCPTHLRPGLPRRGPE
jgi:hypothetical protein